MPRSLIHIVALLLLCALEAVAQPSASVSKASLDFGTARARRGVRDTLLVGAAGAADLVVERLELRTTAFDLPAQSVTSSFTVRAGEATPVVVRFTPPSAGAFSDTLSIRSNGPEVRVPLSGQGVRSTVVINEILADPPGGTEGDANGDGVRDTFQDEFIEVLNVGPRAEDLSGWRLSDDDTAAGSQFTFPQGTLLGPGARAVLFGGGSPSGVPGQVFTDDGRIGNGLTNGGDAALLIDPSGPDTLDALAYGAEGDRDQSLVRSPEGAGGLTLHGGLPGDGAAFSPGRARVVLSGVAVAPADTAVAVGDSIAWRATGFFPDGRSRDVTLAAAWTSEDTAVARVSAGRGKAAGAGGTEIRASVAGLSSPPARLTVRAPGLTALAIAPAETVVVVGGGALFRAEGTLPDGTRRAVTVGLTWTVADTGVALAAGGGAVRPVRAGETTVRASDGRVSSAPATLWVLRKGDLNGAGGVEVADALRLIDLILEASPPATALEQAAADLTGDGRIDVGDLAAIIDVMLGRAGAGKVAACVARYGVRECGEGGIKEVALDCPAEVTALQIDLRGPAKGVTLTGRAKGMAMVTQAGPDGRTRVVIYGLSGQGIAGGSGVVLRFEGAAEVERALVAGWGFSVEALEEGMGSMGSVVTFGLRQSFPNPANGAVVIEYDLPEASEVTLEVFDLRGRRVARLVRGLAPAGRHVLRWDGRDGEGRGVGSGVYLCRLKAGKFMGVRKMVWLK